MPTRKTTFQTGNCYHIYNRGANRELIFRSDENYRFLLKRIGKFTKRDHITVLAYCLMPNHYHFLMRQDGDTSISDCVQSIFNSYTKAFNNMYSRKGTMFEGRFKDVHVDNVDYLLHLCRYIHRNPIDGKKPLVKNIEEWPYSNYLEWIAKRAGKFIDREFVEAYFETPELYQKFVLDYMPPKKLDDDLRDYFLD